MKQAVLLLHVMFAFPAMAQFTLLPTDLLQPVFNERGEMLTFEKQGHVQFLDVSEGVYPPNSDGSPHPNNPVVTTAYIGLGVSGTNNIGLFSVGVDQSSGEVIMARIFNAATIENASFYTDSQTKNIPTALMFNPVFSATTNALDPADDDNDGLNNSWEKSLGSNPALVDSDGDGISDLNEFLAGTGLNDDSSFLALSAMIPQPGGSLIVQWEAVSGKTYQLQGSHLSLVDPAIVFSNINGVVTSSGPVASTEVTNGLSADINQFRIRLLE